MPGKQRRGPAPLPVRDVTGWGPLYNAAARRGGGGRGWEGEGRGGDSDPRQEAAGLAGCSSEGLLAAWPGLGCGR